MTISMHRCIALYAGLATLVPFSGAIGLPFEVGAALESSPSLATFYSMIETSGLLEDSSNDTAAAAVTVFAPINSALALVSNGFVTTLLNDTGFRPHLVNLVLHHTVAGSIQLEDLTSYNSTTLETLSGEPLFLQNQQGLVNLISGMTSAFVTDSFVLGGGSTNSSAPSSNETSTAPSNVVHVVSNALLPKFYYQTLLEASESSFFQELADRLDLADTLQTESLTLFAPTSDAFVSLPSHAFNDTALMRRLLRRHVVRGVYSSFSMFEDNRTAANQTVLRTLSGEEIVVDRLRDGSWAANGVPVVRRDILAQNGVVHQVQGIIGIRKTQPPTSEPTQLPRTLLDEVIADSELSTFRTAITLIPGMNVTLSDVSQGNATVLAPVRTAFQNLDSDLVRTMFQPEWIAHLRAIVRLHVTDRGGLTSQLLKEKGGGNMTMLSGDRVSVSIGSMGTVFVVGPDGVAATTVSPPTEALNGVLLKTDTVLLPNFLQLTVMDVLESSTDVQNFTTFVAMLRQVNFESPLRSGIYSVLAPSNDALAGLGTERLSYLLKEENMDELKTLVLYHIIPGVLPFSRLENETMSFTSENGDIVESVSCDSCGGVGHRFNNISVSVVDLLARNGLVHVLSGVLDISYNATRAPTKNPTAAPSLSPSRLSNTTLQPTVSNNTNRSPEPAAAPNSPTQPTVTSGAEARFFASWPARLLLALFLLPPLL